LEGIGAISKPTTEDARKKGIYQDSVTAPISREHDEEAALLEDEDEDDDDKATPARHALDSAASAVLMARFIALFDARLLINVLQLRKIVRAVRSSPQRRQGWYAEVNISLRRTERALTDAANAAVAIPSHMLILDVKTRWSSTHQMLRMSRSSQYQKSANILMMRRACP
jgi:hypothetical protein